MFIINPSEKLLGVTLIASDDDREVLVEALSNILGISVVGYEAINHRIGSMLDALQNADDSTGVIEVRYTWMDMCFLCFVLEDYKWMIDNDPGFYETEDSELKEVYEQAKKYRRKYLALASYFQECIWEALESVLDEVAIRGYRNLVRKAVPNYKNYYPQALDFLNKNLFETSFEERAGMLKTLVRTLIKKDNGYEMMVDVVNEYAQAHNISPYEVSFQGNSVDLTKEW